MQISSISSVRQARATRSAVRPVHVSYGVLVASLFLLLWLPTDVLLGQQFLIKFATLAPEGSTWMNVMKEYDRQIRKESSGRLAFKIYPGGVQGDEKDVLRKIKLGQLHSAGPKWDSFTSSQTFR